MTVMDLSATLPLIVLVAWGILLIIVDLVIPTGKKNYVALLTALGLALAFGLNLRLFGKEVIVFNGMVAVDGFAVFLNALFLGSGLLGVALAYDYLKRMGIERSEYYILLVFSISGMLLMGMAADLIVVFLALELLSIPLYVLAGFSRPHLDSEEASLKYFLLGAFAGGFVVYGIALVYGATGSTSLASIVSTVQAAKANIVLMTIGAALILVGLGFKVAAVPFHMWTPDVYQGAPTAVTAFMSVGAKAAGFAALLRVFSVAFPMLASNLSPILWGLSALTMIVGNIVAIAQTNLKRLLAYSSIAHAGYILMATVVLGQGSITQSAVAGALFYLVAYALTSFGAWSVVIALEKTENKGLELQDYAGLGHKYPWLAAAMAVFMLSFTGVPPTLGFVGKFYLFSGVIQGGFIDLAIIGVLTSLVSAYYYLRIIVIMYMQDGDPQITSALWSHLTTALTAIATILLGIFSYPLFYWATRAVLAGF
jgi:NADH-quinone oxidoreductase subunit N